MSTLSPVEQFLLDIAIILVLARLFGMLARKLGQPPVIGEIIAGIALGPTLFSGKITKHLFIVENPTTGAPPVNLTGSWLTAIATIGLVLFMFIVGYEVDRACSRAASRSRPRCRSARSRCRWSAARCSGCGSSTGTRHRQQAPAGGAVPGRRDVGDGVPGARPDPHRPRPAPHPHRRLAIASAAVDDIAAWSLLAVVVTIVGSEGGAPPGTSCSRRSTSR